MSRESLTEFLRSEELRFSALFVFGGIAAFRALCWCICKLMGWL